MLSGILIFFNKNVYTLNYIGYVAAKCCPKKSTATSSLSLLMEYIYYMKKNVIFQIYVSALEPQKKFFESNI